MPFKFLLLCVLTLSEVCYSFHRLFGVQRVLPRCSPHTFKPTSFLISRNCDIKVPGSKISWIPRLASPLFGRNHEIEFESESEENDFESDFYDFESEYVYDDDSEQEEETVHRPDDSDESVEKSTSTSGDQETFEAFLETLRSSGKQNRLHRREALKRISTSGGTGVLDGHCFTKDVKDDPLVPQINTIALAGFKRKAEGISAMRVSKVTVMTTFFVILVGKSRPQNDAIAFTINEEMIKQYNRTCSQQGTANSGWMLLDYGDIIVHIMTPKSRQYYDLDGFWGDKGGEVLDLSDILTDFRTLPSFENQFGKEGKGYMISPPSPPESVSSYVINSSPSNDHYENNDDASYDGESVNEADVVQEAIVDSSQFWGSKDTKNETNEALPDRDDPFWS